MNDLNRLHDLAASYMTDHEFEPGDLVTWKPGLRNRVMPDYGEAVVVIEVLAEPVYDQTTDSSSPYFREPLTLRCLVVDKDGDAMIFHYDARRMMPFADYRSSVAN
ncbi:hypothetical protein [Oceanithermus sp.]